MVDQSILRFFEAVFGIEASSVADPGAFLGVALALRAGMMAVCRSVQKVVTEVSATTRLVSRVR
jgi:hypothetical protein